MQQVRDDTFSTVRIVRNGALDRIALTRRAPRIQRTRSVGNIPALVQPNRINFSQVRSILKSSHGMPRSIFGRRKSTSHVTFKVTKGSEQNDDEPAPSSREDDELLIDFSDTDHGPTSNDKVNDEALQPTVATKVYKSAKSKPTSSPTAIDLFDPFTLVSPTTSIRSENEPNNSNLFDSLDWSGIKMPTVTTNAPVDNDIQPLATIRRPIPELLPITVTPRDISTRASVHRQLPALNPIASTKMKPNDLNGRNNASAQVTMTPRHIDWRDIPSTSTGRRLMFDSSDESFGKLAYESDENIGKLSDSDSD